MQKAADGRAISSRWSECGGKYVSQNDGYCKEMLAEGRILCYRLKNTSQRTIDAWAEDLIHEFTHWPAHKPWRLMLDISMNGSIVSAYALRRARQIAAMRPEIRGRLSILIGSRLAAQVISLAIRSSNNNYRQRQVFATEASAIRWLLEDDMGAGQAGLG